MQVHEMRAEKSNLERLIDRARYSAPVTDAELATVRGLWRTAEHHPSGSVIAPCGVRLITSGWAGWMRYGDDGRRLIFLFLMPGDFIVPELFDLESCDLVTLTPLRTVDATTLIEGAAAATPQTARLIASSGRYYRLLLLDHMARLTIGCTKRSVAHLLTEFHARSIHSGACIDGRLSLPIGQRVLARAVGRSTVQVNKVINVLQAEGLLRVGYDWLEVPQPQALRAVAGLSHSILRPSRVDAGLARECAISEVA